MFRGMPLLQHVHVEEVVLLPPIVHIYLIVHLSHSFCNMVLPLPLSHQFIGRSWQQHQHLISWLEAFSLSLSDHTICF